MGKYEHTTSLVVGGKALHKKGVLQSVTSNCYKIAVLSVTGHLIEFSIYQSEKDIIEFARFRGFDHAKE